MRVIVPVDWARNLDRTMLYTAVTRVKRQVIMVGDVGVARCGEPTACFPTPGRLGRHNQGALHMFVTLRTRLHRDATGACTEIPALLASAAVVEPLAGYCFHPREDRQPGVLALSEGGR